MILADEVLRQSVYALTLASEQHVNNVVLL
jgi:hypothetical protein